jgi:tripartite-type tricarboxylate transporter receptor subunit TctC
MSVFTTSSRHGSQAFSRFKHLPIEALAGDDHHPDHLRTAARAIGYRLRQSLVGMKMVHVPYRGTAPSVTDLISGQVQATMAGWPGIGQFVRAGQLRAIGVSAAGRVLYAPDIPAIAETVSGFEAVQWYGILAPAGIPASIINRLNKEIGSMPESPDLLEYLNNEGALPTRSSPDEFRLYIQQEIARWKEVITAAGIERAPA